MRRIPLRPWWGLVVGLSVVMGMTGWGEEQGKAHLHGYAEMHYNVPKTGNVATGQSDPAQMDVHRMVLGLSYAYRDNMRFEVELDFEHAANAADLELEFAYLDWQWSSGLGFRVGSILMPVGPLNEFHEPPLFPGVERPAVEAYIIPTTWQEGGFGFYGSLGAGVSYRTYLVSGLNASGFNARTGLRGGRGKVKAASASSLAWVGRVEWQVGGASGLRLGASGYYGDAQQALLSVGAPFVTIGEGDVRFTSGAWDVLLVGVLTGITDAGTVSVGTGQTIGEQLLGWYVEVRYDLMALMPIEGVDKLTAWYRFELFDTHARMPAGYTKDLKNERSVLTLGLAYYPIRSVALKTDVEGWRDAAGNAMTRWNLGLALMY